MRTPPAWLGALVPDGDDRTVRGCRRQRLFSVLVFAILGRKLVVVVAIVMAMHRHGVDCCSGCRRHHSHWAPASERCRVARRVTTAIQTSRAARYVAGRRGECTSQRDRNDNRGKGRLECHRAHFASPEIAGRISAPAHAVRQETSRHGGEDHRRRFPDCT